MTQPKTSPITLLVAASALLAADAAGAQSRSAPPVTYPATLDPSVVSTWLRKETDIDPNAVVAITPDAVLAVLQSRMVDGALAVIIRGETLTPAATARTKVASWHMTAQVDCARSRIRMGVTSGYAARNLLFDGAPIRPADSDWSTPTPGNPLDLIRQAACDKSFRGPLSTGANVPTLEPQAAPEPETPPPAKKAAPRKPTPAPPAATAPPRTGSAKVSVQIAAAGSETEAASLLDRLKTRNGEAMTGLDTRIVRASVGGKTVFRALVAGFADRTAAVVFCETLKASNQACFVRADLG